MEDIEYGKIVLHIDKIMKEKNISINKLSFRAEMERTQLKKYIKNEIQRLDIMVICRICYALDCDLSDILEYIPPTRKKD